MVKDFKNVSRWHDEFAISLSGKKENFMARN